MLFIKRYFIFRVLNETEKIKVLCIFLSTLQPEWASTAGAFSAYIFMLAAAENYEDSGSRLNQNSNYLSIGTLPYCRKIICYRWCAVRGCHGQSGIKGVILSRWRSCSWSRWSLWNGYRTPQKMNMTVNMQWVYR